ncbi:MAG: RNA methyltransferase [Thermodesulforhabdaceae bacterium]
MKKELSSIQITTIQSTRNETFRHLLSLLSGRGVKKAGETLVFGKKILKEILSTKPDLVKAIIAPASFLASPYDAFLESIRHWYVLTKPLFAELDMFNTGYPFALCNIPLIPKWNPTEGFPYKGCWILLPFQDPENIGSAIRSAAAFGVHNVIILKEGAHPFHPKAVRASAGAVFRIRVHSGPSIEELPDSLPIIPLDASGIKQIEDVRFPKTFGILPGIEGPGLPDRWKTRAVRIPITNAVESLNGSVALSIALYIWSRSIPVRE